MITKGSRDFRSISRRIRDRHHRKASSIYRKAVADTGNTWGRNLYEACDVGILHMQSSHTGLTFRGKLDIGYVWFVLDKCLYKYFEYGLICDKGIQ